MEELIRTPFVREVSAICVDPSPTRPPLPSWLKSVPTLVVLGEDSPRIGPGPVNNWLFERKMGGRAPAPAPATSAPRNSVSFDDRRLEAPVYKVDAVTRPDMTARVAPTSRGDVSVSSNGRLPAAISASTEGDKSAAPPVLAGSDSDSAIAPYHTLEMSDKKWSDIYSFLSSRPRDFAEKTFELLSGILSSGGGGADGAAGGSASARVSEKEAALLREFEAYAAKRDREVKGPTVRR